MARIFRMRRVFLIASAVCASGGIANAADLPSRKAPPPPPPVSVVYAPPSIYAWSGFYVGDHVGYGWANSSTFSYDAANGANPDKRGLNSSGLVSGLQVGYNLRLSTNVVAGVEVDASIAGINGHRYVNNAANTQTMSFERTRTSGIATARLRLGYLLRDNLLLYATGGLAIRNLTSWRTQYATGQALGVAPPFSTFPVSTSKWWSAPLGWTLGAGVEYAFDPRWTVKAEALYMGWPGDTNVDFLQQASLFSYNPNGPTKNVIRKTTYGGTVLALIGVNYQFGGGAAPATVAARY